MLTRRQALSGFALILVPASGAALEQDTLFNVSTRLVTIYQTGDAGALHSMLAPDLQAQYSPEALASWLSEAKATFGPLQRISLPISGTRAFAIFAAYFERAPNDMFLELDRDGRIVLWTLKSDSGAVVLRKR
ncbi:hypothetical protein [Microvirga terricola]|uniref:Uncharacterized protein n=1 Tax=Microvirga terricola TaxID=2719797 RepID=A0ABX0V729_9HYPH|nr:hypothetical protein [Microvirga terricola]NIX75655.1 hypothetical protein [Microvirga terricola]